MKKYFDRRGNWWWRCWQRKFSLFCSLFFPCNTHNDVSLIFLFFVLFYFMPAFRYVFVYGKDLLLCLKASCWVFFASDFLLTALPDCLVRILVVDVFYCRTSLATLIRFPIVALTFAWLNQFPWFSLARKGLLFFIMASPNMFKMSLRWYIGFGKKAALIRSGHNLAFIYMTQSAVKGPKTASILTCLAFLRTRSNFSSNSCSGITRYIMRNMYSLSYESFSYWRTDKYSWNIFYYRPDNRSPVLSRIHTVTTRAFTWQSRWGKMKYKQGFKYSILSTTKTWCVPTTFRHIDVRMDGKI